MQRFQFSAQDADATLRLDVFLTERAVGISRSQIQHAIRQGRAQVNGMPAKPSHKICSGDLIVLDIHDPVPMAAQPENIPLDILFEDSSIVVINKAAGMVVHPACGNYTGTLVNALLHHCTSLSGIGGVLRPGIVHRLDKGTTGVLVVAKNDVAHHGLSEQFKRHSIIRKYQALVYGVPSEEGGTITGPIGRHKTHRKKMAIRTRKGKHAVTHWRVIETFDTLTLLEARLETGRTHQVRVHCASIGHPLLGDETYGAASRLKNITDKQLQDFLRAINRPLLHAGYLQFDHPETGQCMSFEAPLPDDFAVVLQRLRGMYAA